MPVAIAATLVGLVLALGAIAALGRWIRPAAPKPANSAREGSMTLRRAGLLLLALVVLGLGAPAWRLDRGPVALPFLVPRIEAALAARGLERVELDAVHLAWRGWGDGGPAPVEIRLSGLRAALPSGAGAVELPAAAVSIPLSALLRGALAPSRITLRDPLLRLRRTEDGSLDLGPLGTPGSGSQAAQPGGAASALDALRHLSVTGGRVVVEDARPGVDWRLRDVSLLLSRNAGALPTGQGSAELLLGGEAMPLSVRATAAEGEGSLRVALHAPLLVPSALARAVPALAPLGLADAPAALSAAIVLGADGALRQAEADLEAGAGTLDLPEAGRLSFTLLRASVRAEPDTVRLERLLLRLPPAAENGSTGPTLTATGHASLVDGRWRGEADLMLDQVSLAALETWWPRGLAPAARGWVADNLVAGTLRDGRWRATATTPRDLSEASLTGLDGTARLDEVAVRWHPALPPLAGLSGTAVFDGAGITLQAEGGRQEGTALRLPEGRLRLEGLGAGPATAELRGRVTGQVADLLSLLRSPALGLLAGREVPVLNPTGTLDGEFAASIPLAGPSAPAEPHYAATALLTELRLPDLVMGRTLAGGSFEVTLETGRLRASGTARFADIPVRGTLAIGFGAAPPDVTLSAQARFDVVRLAAFGVAPGDAMQGELAMQARYQASGSGPARVRVEVGLEKARIAVAPLGYVKPRGAAARAEAVLLVGDDGLRAIDRLDVVAPGLRLLARTARDSRVLEIAEGRIGETAFGGTVIPPEGTAGMWRMVLRGPVLDLRPILAATPAPAGTPPVDGAAPGVALPPLALDLRFDRVLTPGPKPLQEVALQAVLGGGTLREARLDAAQPARLSASLSAGPAGGRALRIEASDAGALLTAIGHATPLEGGRLEVAATQPVPGGPASGMAQLADFTLYEMPVAAKLLQSLSGYGLLEALSGPGVRVSRLTAPFRFDAGVLTLDEARAFSASLGVTANGRIDLRRGSLDLNGTVVPAYIFNSLLGNLPIVGQLFSPEAGGGLFAARFDLEGPWRDPRVSVNPLSALTPGFLRRLFELGGDAPEEAEAGAPPG